MMASNAKIILSGVVGRCIKEITKHRWDDKDRGEQKYSYNKTNEIY